MTFFLYKSYDTSRLSMNCFWRKLAAVIHEDCLLCKCFHILTFVELNARLFWFSINETKETARSAVNKWDDFLLQEDVWLQWEGQHALCSWIGWILSNLFLIFFEPKTTTKKSRNKYACIVNETPMQTRLLFQNTQAIYLRRVSFF